MNDRKTKARLDAKINTAQERPLFSEAQLKTFNSNYVDSLDEALSVLDENNKTVQGHTKSFRESEEES